MSDDLADGWDMKLFRAAITDSLPIDIWFSALKVSEYMAAALRWVPPQGTLWERVTS